MALAICPPGQHRHAQPLTGGRCAFPAEKRPGGICGRAPVAVYVNPDATPRNTFRCRSHDRDVVVAEAARMGWTRQAVTRG